MKYIIAEKEKNLKLFEYIQLFSIYFYSFCSINSSIYLYNNGSIPTYFLDLFPFLYKIMNIRTTEYFSSDKSLLLHLIIIDLIRRPFIPLSRIIKFNLILTYMFEFSLIIVVYFWDLLISKDIQIVSTELRSEAYIHNPFYSVIWIFYAIIYIYCLIFAFQKKYPIFGKPFHKIVPSIHYYLDLRMPIEKKLLKKPKNINN